MSVIIFIIILSVLVFVHEMGHFLVAKKAGVRVDEFGFGFPPRMLKIGAWRGTSFTLNWIPFGGFVKIFGENYVEDTKFDLLETEKPFTDAHKLWQVAILVAGVTFNFVLAWILISLGFAIGMPQSTSSEHGAKIKDPELMIVGVLPDSPAFKAGVKSGDVIKSLERNTGIITNPTSSQVSDFVSNTPGEVKLTVERGDGIEVFEIIPSESVVSGRLALGINMDEVGFLKLPPHEALWEGLKTTVTITVETVKGLGNLLLDGIKGKGDLSQVTGPVGIVGIVGDASALGFVYLLTFAAFISINLAIINLIPFPSLDGGRILFVIIETIKGSPVNPKAFNILNTVGFAILILLMITITIRDIGNLF